MEYYSLSYALHKGLWIHLFLTSLQLPIPTPFPLLCNNQSAIKLTNSNINSSWSKHIDVQYHFICKNIEDETFITTWILIGDMTTDIFTKPLLFPSFSKHRQALGIIPVLWFLLFCYLHFFFSPFSLFFFVFPLPGQDGGVLDLWSYPVWICHTFHSLPLLITCYHSLYTDDTTSFPPQLSTIPWHWGIVIPCHTLLAVLIITCPSLYTWLGLTAVISYVPLSIIKCGHIDK